MSDKIIQFDDAMFESKLDALVRVKVEQTINAMLDAEADEIANAARYERKTDRRAFRAGHYERTLTAKAGKLSLKVPKLKGALFESAVIERYRRRESSVEEALMEMYLAGVSTRRVDGISQLLWGERMPSQTLSDKLKKIYKEIDEWRKRPLESEYPYVFVDGVWHKRSWGGHVENVSVLVAIGVSTEGRREVIAVDEGMREDAASWEQFFRSMIERGLRGVRLVVGDRCAGLVSTVNSMLPNAKYQRCMVHFMRNVLSKTPPSHREWASVVAGPVRLAPLLAFVSGGPGDLVGLGVEHGVEDLGHLLGDQPVEFGLEQVLVDLYDVAVGHGCASCFPIAILCLATENRTQDAGHARFNISTKNKTESAQEFGRYQIRQSIFVDIPQKQIPTTWSHVILNHHDYQQ